MSAIDKIKEEIALINAAKKFAHPTIEVVGASGLRSKLAIDSIDFGNFKKELLSTAEKNLVAAQKELDNLLAS